MPTFQIPKQTDRSLIAALQAILDDLEEFKKDFLIRVRTVDGPGGQDLHLPNDEKDPVLAQVLAAESELMPHFYLRGHGKHIALHIARKPTFIDEVQVAQDQNWINAVPERHRGLLTIKLVASAQKHLRAVSFDGTTSGTSDSAWSHYRHAQEAILHGLQQTQRTILEEFTRKSLEMEADSKARLQTREAELQKHYETLQEQLNQKFISDSERVAIRETEIEEREKRFNTREARYVARAEQQKQIEDIKGWLQDWSLTKGTRAKRYVVIAAYSIGALFTAILTVWFSSETMAIIESSKGQLSWWQWLLLALKSIFPLAAFITLVIAFIRWSTDWAKQHADEEFRNRARVLDIGRTAWLLEAVRDAQDSNKELPPELLKELSRNLFAYSPATDNSDLHPQAISDMIMHGLNSLRVKTPDGSEIEAKRKG